MFILDTKNVKFVSARFGAHLKRGLAVVFLIVATISGILTAGSLSPVYAAEPAAPAAPEAPALPNQEVQIECPEGRCLFDKYINPLINTLSALVGVAVTISIIVAGIRYGTSADNSQKVSEAKQRMVTSILVLVGYFLFYAFLNYIIPGGLIGGGP